MRKRLLILGIALLSFAYGHFTTVARVSAGEAHAVNVAVAEMASAAPAVLFGWLADKKGMRTAAALSPASAIFALMGSSPLIVFLTLSTFYAAFIVALLASYSCGEEELGAAVGTLSLGWALGVSAAAYVSDLHLSSSTFALGSLSVLLAVDNAPASSNFLDPLPTLKKFIPPLAIFMAAEYVSYALTAWRFYHITTPELFALSYAIAPGVTSFLGGILAGKALKLFGAERVFLGAIFTYPVVVLMALLAPPPFCLIAWSVPVYPFYEVGLVATVAKLCPNAKGASLGLTYSTMALSSLIAMPFTRLNNIVSVATMSVLLMVVSGIVMKKIIFHNEVVPKRASQRPSA